MRFRTLCFAVILTFFAQHPLAEIPEAEGCSDMEVWDYSKWMCTPLPMPGMPMRMMMVHGNGFAAGIKAEGPRGGQHFAAPNMVMADYGSSAGDHHYLNADLMVTLEKWTVPGSGYPELGQVGDYDSKGQLYIDRQHPHSSPIMGLTLSDTIAISESKDFLNVFFAPRGETTDGPISFMHRPTGAANPVAPLSHHVAQDSGHVSSTVIGALLGIGAHRLEFSTFHGLEPSPTEVDLPTSKPDSYAGRLTMAFNPRWSAMLSYAYVRHPDPHVPDIDHYTRYSISMYNTIHLNSKWTLYNSLIHGLLRNPNDQSEFTFNWKLSSSPPRIECVGVVPPGAPGQKPIFPVLNSFVEEFLFNSAGSKFWGRGELVQRTPFDLAVFDDPSPTKARWLGAATLGYTRTLHHWGGSELNAGAAITKIFLPVQFQSHYGGNPLTEMTFLQLQGMEMWNL